MQKCFFFIAIAFGHFGFSQNPGLPIKAARTISFKTNECSYTDIDISADGKTIVFTLLGEIYILPISGGTAKQLTRGLAINSFPVWSPNGKYIAYVSDRDGMRHLTLLEVETKKITTIGRGDPEIALNDKPKWIEGSNSITVGKLIYDLSGNKKDLPAEFSIILGYSENGKIIYSAEKQEEKVSIYSYNIKTREKIDFVTLNENLGKFENPIISPNRRWLIYMEGKLRMLDSLIVYDLTTKQKKTLARFKFDSDFNTLKKYAVSPDSKNFYAAYGGKIHAFNIQKATEKIIPFTANVKFDMGALNYNTYPVSVDSFEVKYMRSAHISPNGKQMVFSALGSLYVINFPDSTPHKLVDQEMGQFEPAYSADGNWIAYATWKDTEGGHIWRIPAKGGIPEQITNSPGQYQNPCWSPNGKYIVVAKGTNRLGIRDNPGNGDIQLISVNDRRLQIIAQGVSLFNLPSFSLNGENIIYKPKISNSDTISPILVSQNIETGVIKVIATGSIKQSEPIAVRQIILSPDGKYLVYENFEKLFIVPIPTDNNPVLVYDQKKKCLGTKFSDGGIDLHWERDGKILSWSLGNEYYCIEPNKITEGSKIIRPDKKIAINLKAAVYHGKGIMAFRNARIITMKGRVIFEHGTALIKDGRFIGVGPNGTINIPDKATTFDFTGKTIIPGLIDMHDHMYLPPDILPQQSFMFLSNLAYGITTARDPSASYDQYGYVELLKKGKMIGPRLYIVGSAIKKKYSISRFSDVYALVENRKRMGGTDIKQYTLTTRLQKQWTLIASKKAGLNMTNETEQDPLRFLAMIKDGSTGVEHNPVFGDIHSDFLKLISLSGTYLTPTLQVAYGPPAKFYFHKLYDTISKNSKFMNFIPEDDEQFINATNFSKKDQFKYERADFIRYSRIDAEIFKNGGKIVLGSHGEDEDRGIGAHYELWALQIGGLSNFEALQVATINGAQAIGIQNDVGSIEIGKIADLIILDKNPLEDIHNSLSIKYVMKDGVLYDGNTLDIIWPEKKALPEWRMK